MEQRPEPKAPEGNPSGFLVGGFLLPDDGLISKPKRKRPPEKPSGFSTHENWKPPSPLKLFMGIFSSVIAGCLLLLFLYIVSEAFIITLESDPLGAIVALVLFFCLFVWSLIVLASKLP